VTGADFTTLANGVYTVVVSDGKTSLSGTGAYQLYFVLAPGSPGKPLTSGVPTTGQLAVGALDVYTFTAQAGQLVTATGSGGVDGGPFPFSIAVYDPSGATEATANFRAPASGAFTLVVFDGTTGRARTGSYGISITTQ
jgi:hypothetical protein